MVLAGCQFGCTHTGVRWWRFCETGPVFFVDSRCCCYWLPNLISFGSFFRLNWPLEWTCINIIFHYPIQGYMYICSVCVCVYMDVIEKVCMAVKRPPKGQFYWIKLRHDTTSSQASESISPSGQKIFSAPLCPPRHTFHYFHMRVYILVLPTTHRPTKSNLMCAKFNYSWMIKIDNGAF